MQTNISKWMIYISSCLPLYIILLLRLLLSTDDNDMGLVDVINNNITSSWGVILALIVLSVVSLLWVHYLRKIKENVRIKYNLNQNATLETIAFIVPYFISIITITMDWYGILVNAVLFIILGVVIVAADAIQFCPVFLLLGYRLFKSEKVYIFTHLSKEQYNSYLLDECNGIEAKEIVRNVYLVKQKSF